MKVPDFAKAFLLHRSLSASETALSNEDSIKCASSQEQEDDIALAEKLRSACQAVREQVAQAVVGQSNVIDQLLIAILSGGHCLLEGVPGLAKTLMVRSLAKSLDLSFHRIQFTPDLMPADITGTDIIQESRDSGQRVLVFERGPIFAQIVLADEINRTPPKTQAALLEAMQEHEVTVGGKTYTLAEPFFVLATQNPIEQEGTYPLPEAQRDRFLFLIRVDYPTRDQESDIIDVTTSDRDYTIAPVVGGEDILRFQSLIRRVPIAQNVKELVLNIVRGLRPDKTDKNHWANELLDWGPGPRAGQQLVIAAKANALLEGHYHVTQDDILKFAKPVLRHRIVPSFSAESQGVEADDLIDRVLSSIDNV